MSTVDEAMNKLADIVASLNNYDYYSPSSWNTGTAGEAQAYRWGRIVVLKIINPTKLAKGANTCFTLPVGWRPYGMEYVHVLTAPNATTGASDLRASISTNGNVSIYNYRSSAISGNTNSSGSFTYICDRTWGS